MPKKRKQVKYKKPKLANGLTPEQLAALQGGAGLLGSAANDGSVGGAGVSGALSGASAGMALGPIGALAGGVIGGVTSLLGARQKKKAAEEAAAKQKQAINSATLDNSFNGSAGLPTFKNGGKLASGGVIGGGSLEPISNDAVEVNANNPSETDSVELRDAFVDNNEIIDNQNRVFSDDLKTPSGISIAKQAKKFEKMKSKNPRFEGANNRIEGKLDELFAYQAKLNQNIGQGELSPEGQQDVGSSPDPKLDKFNKFLQSRGKKPVRALGGTLPDPIDPPKFKNKAEHDAYYRKQLIEKAKIDRPNIFESYAGSADGSIEEVGEPIDENTLIAIMGGIPAWEAPTQSSPSKVQTDISKIKQINPKVGGYRYKKGKPAKGSITKRRFAEGGDLDDPFKQKTNFGIIDPNMISNPFANTFTHSLDPSQGREDGFAGSAGPSSQANKPFDWRKAGTMAATFGPDVFNTFLTSRMPKPNLPTPKMEKQRRLERVRPDAALAANARITSNIGRQISAANSQSSAIGSNLGSLLAKRLYGDNAVRSDYNRLNAQIGAQEAQMNTGIGARNTERTNSRNLNQHMLELERKNRQLSGLSQISSNVGNKVLQLGQEKNFKDMSLAELEVLKKGYEESGVYNRRLEELITKALEKQGMKAGKRYGGMLKGLRRC